MRRHSRGKRRSESRNPLCRHNVATWNKTNPSADEKRFPSTGAPLSRAVTSSSRPASRSRTPAAVFPVAPVPVSWHPAYWFYKLVRARAMRALSSPYSPSFRCPPLPSLHRRFVWRRRFRLAHPHGISEIRECHVRNIFLCGNFIYEKRERVDGLLLHKKHSEGISMFDINTKKKI